MTMMHSSWKVLMGLWWSTWSCKLSSFMHRLLQFLKQWKYGRQKKKIHNLTVFAWLPFEIRWEDTRAQMSMLSSLCTYLSQCFHPCSTRRFWKSIFFHVTYVKIQLMTTSFIFLSYLNFMRNFNISLILIRWVSEDWLMIVLVFTHFSEKERLNTTIWHIIIVVN